jgi:peroxiredoxin
MKRIILFLLILSVAAFAGDMKSLKIGDKAPSFALKNYDGKEFTLEKHLKENKYTVLMWISTECPVSNAYNERMVKLYDAYAGKGIAFVGMNSNKAEQVADITKHSKEKGFKFPVLKDDMNKIADLYAAQVTPEVFVLDAKGAILYHGRIDDSKNAEKVEKKDLAAALDALLAGKKVENAETKAFGCTVKRVEKPQLSE